MAGYGGKRPGAGRPKGSKNKRTRKLEEARVDAMEQGITPLEYMLNVLRNSDSDEADKRWAAQAAAPYVHPRLQQISAEVDQTNRELSPNASAHNLSVLEKARKTGAA